MVMMEVVKVCHETVALDQLRFSHHWSACNHTLMCVEESASLNPNFSRAPALLMNRTTHVDVFVWFAC